MKLYVARHGQTNYNDLGLCNSDPKTDVYLTNIGRAQVEKLSSQLKDVPLDQIFVSELKRTKQTANIVNKHHKVLIEVDSRLNDIRSGYEDKHYLEYHAAFHNAENKWSARFNGGESWEDVKERVRDFLVNDGGGSAARELLVRARLPHPVTPTGMSNALNRLRAHGAVTTSTNETKTYGIWLSRPLSDTTVQALKREEDWARAVILKQPRTEPGWPPPEITFAEDDEVHADPDDARMLPTANGSVHDSGVVNGFRVSSDVTTLMWIIVEQSKTIRSLRAELGQTGDDDRLGSDLVAFLTNYLD